MRVSTEYQQDKPHKLTKQEAINMVASGDDRELYLTAGDYDELTEEEKILMINRYVFIVSDKAAAALLKIGHIPDSYDELHINLYMKQNDREFFSKYRLLFNIPPESK